MPGTFSLDLWVTGIAVLSSNGGYKMALFDVLAHDNVDDCRAILERDPSCVNTEGWHGITPLHRAATRGNIQALQVLLQYGAEVNKLNGFGETPLHYACQAASLKFVHILVENGADLKALDNGGRSCVHHAARSGSIGQTVLHIAAEHGHIDLLEYCLKKNRFEPGVLDNSKLTPLHIAAQHSNRQCAWILESASPDSLVSLPDIHGKTPVDYAAEGTTREHRWLATHLKYWQASRCAGYRPAPWFPWLLLLLFPSFLIVFVVWTLQTFSESTGRIISAGAVLFFYSWALTGHRLRHVSALPSPTFAGLFFGVILQSLGCYYVHLVPILWPELFWLTLSIFLFIIVVIALRYLFSDPGVVTSTREKENGEPYTILDVAKGTIPVDDFCFHCEIVTPNLAKHCRLCGQCVLGIDHHCLFLMWCVAHKNHRAFIFFMALIMVAQVFFIRAAIACLSSLVQTDGTFPASFREAMGADIYVSTLLVINIFGLFYVTTLMTYQIKLVSEGATTFYTPDGKHKTKISFKEICEWGPPSLVTRAQNLFKFCVGEFSFYQNMQKHLDV